MKKEDKDEEYEKAFFPPSDRNPSDDFNQLIDSIGCIVYLIGLLFLIIWIVYSICTGQLK